MNKQYKWAFIVQSEKLTLNQPRVMLRQDNKDYYTKKFRRQSEQVEVVDLPHGMPRQSALNWLKVNYADNQFYQTAVANSMTEEGRRRQQPVSAEERLRRITLRVLNARAKVQELEQEQQEIQDILAIVERG